MRNPHADYVWHPARGKTCVIHMQIIFGAQQGAYYAYCTCSTHLGT